MTLGANLADKIKEQNEQIKWNEVLEEIDWKQEIAERGPKVASVLEGVRVKHPGWYFETMTPKGLAKYLKDLGFVVYEDITYSVYNKESL